ncbi:porin family protein [Chitinophaga sp. RCC_12]|uniref:porin family protein n=1 Tax=unclassified Chitinophaga TaxID=2619133 RepID=UPI003523EE1B
MKKLILSGVLAIGTMLAVQAQNVKFGVKGGLNISKLTDTDGSKTLAGFHAGGLVNIGLNESWAIQPEVLYSAQGTKAEKSVLWLTTSNTVKVNYINVPVMVQYSIVPEFYLEAGPQVGFLTAAKVKSGDVTVDIKDDMQSVDFGLGFGFGYKFDMGLGISGRYNFGLTNVYDSDKVDSKNSVAQIGVFYTF